MPKHHKKSRRVPTNAPPADAPLIFNIVPTKTIDFDDIPGLMDPVTRSKQIHDTVDSAFALKRAQDIGIFLNDHGHELSKRNRDTLADIALNTIYSNIASIDGNGAAFLANYKNLIG